MKYRVDIPIQHKDTGAKGWQCVVVEATVSREARCLALLEAGDLNAVRHRRDAVLVLNDPTRPINVLDVTLG
ncbi:hypothetical protein [Streptomyces sp. CT34]|uniref:hypothetical protein n=1 Tax=Streptomyces sp. CT34 TaxID=1553907 RepID=UPI0005B9001F|nr:hypothetical protein [Streptomyces sp. CT34]